ncbi:MAG: DinB family protein [Caldimonas sp.]
MKPPNDTESSPGGAAAMRSYFESLARYHVWATARLCEHVETLSEGDYRKDAGLFFKSVHGTCNHLLVAEHALWYPRFAEGVSHKIALDVELEKDRAALRERLLAAVPRWQALIASLDDARFVATLDYTTTRGIALSLPFAPTLGHVFNHATHHRGQITAAITAMGYPCPEIDWVWMLQAERRGPTTS